MLLKARDRMKRALIYSTVTVFVVVVATIAIARADAQRWHRWGHPNPLAYVAHELNLNDAQKLQIKSMWHAERPVFSSLVRQLANESKEMDAATAQGNLDEGKVQEIAARQGATVARLLVEMERFKARVYTAVLTPEQRTKGDELQKRWQTRLDQILSQIEHSNNDRTAH